MLKVGLTGGIASGKSTVARILVELGAHLVDTDQLARQAVEPGSPALAEITSAFGPGVLDAGGGLDRRGLREVVFSNAAARARLNAIVHPRVAALVEAELARLAALDPEGVALVDVPLLFESGWDRRYHVTLVVYVPPATQMARLMARDQVDEAQARAALSAQMPLADKRARAHFVIDNSGGLDDTFAQVRTVWRRLRELAASHSQPELADLNS
jgi:dephospho-CoA kinase